MRLAALLLFALALPAAADVVVPVCHGYGCIVQDEIRYSEAQVAQLTSEIDDSSLLAPMPGIVQLRLAEPGEVLGAGGRVLNLIDVSDVFMTFFLPEAVAGRVPVGSEAFMQAFPAA